MKKDKKIFCMVCGGTGKIRMPDDILGRSIVCLRCAGTGRVNPPAVPETARPGAEKKEEKPEQKREHRTDARPEKKRDYSKSIGLLL